MSEALFRVEVRRRRRADEKPGAVAGFILSPVIRKRRLFVRFWRFPFSGIFPVLWTIIRWILQRVVFVGIVRIQRRLIRTWLRLGRNRTFRLVVETRISRHNHLSNDFPENLGRIGLRSGELPGAFE